MENKLFLHQDNKLIYLLVKIGDEFYFIKLQLQWIACKSCKSSNICDRYLELYGLSLCHHNKISVYPNKCQKLSPYLSRYILKHLEIYE